MGNSTRTLQSIVDATSTIGDLTPILKDASGWAAEPALTIGNAVMTDLVAARFPYKWNRIKVPGILLTSAQQDYATVNLTDLAWIETAALVDINSASAIKNVYPIEAVRTLDFTSSSAGQPRRVASMSNEQLEFGRWPGPNVVYTNPQGATVGPSNPPTNILDPDGAILILTVYGTTGTNYPQAPANSVPGATVADGSCLWTVADAGATGFRIDARPPTGGGTVWLLRIFGQAKPVRFENLSDTLDPIPDDESKWFEDGFIAYAHRYSGDPAVRAKFEAKKAGWLQSLGESAKAADREAESFGFFPARTVVSPGPYSGVWPLPGRRIN